jgi:hypothetical protein
MDEKSAALAEAKRDTKKRLARLHKRGLTIYGEKLLRQQQNNACAGCFDPLGETFVIDHCHRTGRRRGLLCHRCNTALGLARDNADTLRRLADYLD